ncbi:hypothetical protein [uncultured Dysosmobacter sp.]|uniref:hypothetical protein n=1 Tax=uncultured Dysosmobacter sp. TaxID=2591384 RepID=UPI002617FC54|nr:hypothetical protein [uncultured Dysosmobacter sp.]
MPLNLKDLIGDEYDEELRDLLITTSVITKRLATKMEEAYRTREKGEKCYGQNERACNRA